MIDIAIIGAGPAGLSAGINALMRKRNTTVFGRDRKTSLLHKAELVNNHIGMPNMSGAELLDNFYTHSTNMGLEIKIGRVLQILPMDNYFILNFDNNIENARALILAPGIVKSNKIKGEDEFLGRGLSYCATCDGMLFKEKEIVVIAESDEAYEDTEFLSKIASKIYFVYHDKKEYSGPGNVINICAKPLEVLGDDFVTGLKTEKEIISAQGIFFIKAAMPFDSLIPGIETINGMIKTDRFMQTNISGVFAAGDCTGWPYQLSKAVGEGLIAAQQADRYLTTNTFK